MFVTAGLTGNTVLFMEHPEYFCICRLKNCIKRYQHNIVCLKGYTNKNKLAIGHNTLFESKKMSTLSDFV